MARIVGITHISISEKRDTVVGTLKDGLRRLKDLQPAAHSAEAEKAEEDATKCDNASFKTTFDFLKRVSTAKQLGEILLCDMQGPEKVPLKVIEYPVCYLIRNYLARVQTKQNPDLWIKYYEKHDFGEFRWEWLSPRSKEKVGGKHLDFIERKSGEQYIVAVSYMKEEIKGFPVPLELAPLRKPCCDEDCHNLGDHLSTLWPDHSVSKARRFDGSCLMDRTFDNNLFDNRTNDLCIELVPKPITT